MYVRLEQRYRRKQEEGIKMIGFDAELDPNHVKCTAIIVRCCYMAQSSGLRLTHAHLPWFIALCRTRNIHHVIWAGGGRRANWKTEETINHHLKGLLCTWKFFNLSPAKIPKHIFYLDITIGEQRTRATWNVHVRVL